MMTDSIPVNSYNAELLRSSSEDAAAPFNGHHGSSAKGNSQISARAITKNNHVPTGAGEGHGQMPWNGTVRVMTSETWRPQNGHNQQHGLDPRQNPHIIPDPYQHAPTAYQRFNHPLNAVGPVGLAGEISDTTTRFIRPIPPPGLVAPQANLHTAGGSTQFVPTSSTVSDLTFQLGNSCLSPIVSSENGIWSNDAVNTAVSADFDDSDSDDGYSLSHPNKYPVEIEYHENKSCVYKRQPTRSGLKVKQLRSSVYDPHTAQNRTETQHIKYYQKDLVRICRCGKYNQMDGALIHGRSNDCDGYEIHYSQKCKWKAYDDYRTGRRVLIRLCKCYKPT